MNTETVTIELSAKTLRLAEQAAKARHIPVSELLAHAIEEQARPDPSTRARILEAATELSHLEDENARITELIDREFNSSLGHWRKESAA